MIMFLIMFLITCIDSLVLTSVLTSVLTAVLTGGEMYICLYHLYGLYVLIMCIEECIEYVY